MIILYKERKKKRSKINTQRCKILLKERKKLLKMMNKLCDERTKDRMKKYNEERRNKTNEGKRK